MSDVDEKDIATQNLPAATDKGRTSADGDCTRITRETILQDCRVVVPRYQGCNRLITLCTPSSPLMYIVLDQTGENLGMDRTYKMAPLPPNQRISFVLRRGQFITLACETGMGTVAIIDECLDDGPARGNAPNGEKR